MAQVRAFFWDIGGVLLNNAWDGNERKLALNKFGLDAAEFERRHATLVSSFERGQIGLEEYLDRTVFYSPRDFSRDVFRDFMFSLSQPQPEALELAHALATSGRYFMATMNNESRELNAYRIQTFGLREIFSLFVTSCFVGLRKPDDAIYRLALDLAQRNPEECCFIDDRAENLEPAIRIGMRAIHMKNAQQLRQELSVLGANI